MCYFFWQGAYGDVYEARIVGGPLNGTRAVAKSAVTPEYSRAHSYPWSERESESCSRATTCANERECVCVRERGRERARERERDAEGERDVTRAVAKSAVLSSSLLSLLVLEGP